MGLSTGITWEKLTGWFAQMGGTVNTLGNKNFSDAAEIAANKILGTAVLQTAVSVTHKGGGAANSDICRQDQNGDLWLPNKYDYGGGRSGLVPNYADGAFSFYTFSTVRAYVDNTGWHNGTPPAAPAVTQLAVQFYPEISAWALSINGIETAFIDANNISGVFVNSLISGDRAQSDGAYWDFSQVGRIDIWHKFVDQSYILIGHITIGGTVQDI